MRIPLKDFDNQVFDDEDEEVEVEEKEAASEIAQELESRDQCNDSNPPANERQERPEDKHRGSLRESSDLSEAEEVPQNKVCDKDCPCVYNSRLLIWADWHSSRGASLCDVCVSYALAGRHSAIE